jgi:hypothetical protein
LSTALRGLDTINGALATWHPAKTDVASVEKSSDLAEFRRYAGEVVALADAQSKSAKLADETPPTLAPPSQSQVTNPKDVLNTRLQQLIRQLWYLDRNYAGTIDSAFHGLDRHPEYNTVPDFLNAVTTAIKIRDQGYRDLQPELNQLVSEVLQALPAVDSEKDKSRFAQLNTTALIPTPNPTAPNKRDDSYKYSSMKRYLVELDIKLGNKLPTDVNPELYE